MKRILFNTVLLFAGILAYAANVKKSMKHLPDSGQTTSYTSIYGADNSYTIFPPYYVNNSNGTITDTVTGLMWQAVDGGEMTIENARAYVDSLSLAGYTDWRLPTAHEAETILNMDKLNPAMDTVYFPNTLAAYWWTSQTRFDDTTVIWVTNAGGGLGPHPKAETISAGGVKSFHVRAVRDVVAPPLVNHFTDNGDSTITDNITGLIWQKYPSTDTLSWNAALYYADSLYCGGEHDWRLPNIKELGSINDESRNAPSIDISYFPNIVASRYWSSTTQFNQVGNAWFNDFQNYGITSYYSKSKAYHVICVRGYTNSTLAIKGQNSSGYYISAYPNPAKNMLYLNCAGISNRLKITIVDAQGKTYLRLADYSICSAMDVSQLLSGNYFAIIENSDLQKPEIIAIVINKDSQ